MKTIFSLFFLLLSSICFAQNTTPKNELGLNLYGNEIVLGRSDMIHFPFYGLQYKRRLTNGYWLRSSSQYYSESHEYNIDGNDISWTKGVSTNKLLDTRLGIEKTFLNNKKIRPFLLADIDYRYQIYEDIAQDFDYQYKRISHYLGAFVGAGLKYYPTKHLYLSAETSIGFNTRIFYGSLNPVYNQYFNPIKTIAFGVRF